jgi:hypothetical protein
MAGPAYHGRTHSPGGTDPIAELTIEWEDVGDPGTPTPAFVGCRLYGSVGAGVQTIPDDTLTGIQFDSESFDTDGYHSTSSNTDRITIPSGRAGKYHLIGNAIDVPPGGGTVGQRVLMFWKNAGTLIEPRDTWESYLGYASGTTVNVVAIPLHVDQILELAVGDYVRLMFLQRTGGSGSIDAQFCNFAAHWLGA